MKLECWIYMLKDFHGTKRYAMVEECSDNICIGGYDKNNVYRQFDSYEAYHLGGFCEQHEGFEYNCKKIEVEVPSELL